MIAISLCVLLLATYCYSVPVNPRVTTANYQYTTGQTILRGNDTVNMRLMNSAESTAAPILQKPQVGMASNSGEYTTPAPFGRQMGLVPRVSAKSSVQNASMNSAEATFAKNFNNFQFTTMETKKQFQKKTIGSDFEETDETEADSKREAQDDDLDADQEAEAKREVHDDDDADADQEAEAKREVQDDDADADQEAEAKREVHDDDDADADQEAEAKREVQDDDADADQEAEAKREVHDDDDADADQEAESKREVEDDDADADQEAEAKRETEDQDLEEDSESKRAIAGNSLEVTTSAFSSVPSSKPTKTMKSPRSRSNSKSRPRKPIQATSAELTTGSSQIVRKTPVQVAGTKTSV